MSLRRERLTVTGVVQGVGFRPFVHAQATSLGLAGLVGNDDSGVFIEVQGTLDAIDRFDAALRADAPPLSRIDRIDRTEIPVLEDTGFRVVSSRSASGAVTAIPPDTAVCDACWSDVRDPGNRRYRYPFTTCTNCGPRYTLITGLPYDRPRTTMAGFALCGPCTAEYEDVADRRFHAQPIACPDCGPTLAFARHGQASTGDVALGDAIEALARGEIVAIKGIGGYHLACDATNPGAVQRLRERKGRGSKPFAVMVGDLDAAAGIVELDPRLRGALASREAPIVLAPARDGDLCDRVAPGQGRIGVMLAYSPLHRLLFTPHPDRPEVRSPTVLVMTSGNLSDEPLCLDEAEAEERLSGIADAFLHHDRPIHVACDDSVIAETGQPVRRSRGYAPLPLPLPLPLPSPPLLAVGGEIKTTLCIADGNRAWLSQHIGDTANLETLALLSRTATTMGELLRIVPDVVVTDQHPGYLSRRWGGDLASSIGAQALAVQHHHAHLASLLAEHAIPPGEPVIGFAFDGTGYGTDGTIWGGEVLLGSYASVTRVAHLRPIPLPGGDGAIHRPARTALAHLRSAGVADATGLPPALAMDPTEIRVVEGMLTSGSHCTPTTSMGRLFDAVSSLLDVCHTADYEGQAAIELEALAESASSAGSPGMFALDRSSDVLIADPAPVLADLVAGVRSGTPRHELARGFHEAVATAVGSLAEEIRASTGVHTVGLTGGVFANRTLEALCRGRLETVGFTVLGHRIVPPNDGGLALGQAAVAAAMCGG